MSDKPLFEVLYPDADQNFRIWADGRIEGFPPGPIIFNRAQQFANQRAADALEARLADITEAVRSGLQPLMMYDAALDDRRPVTQEDVDRLVILAAAAERALRVLQSPKSLTC
jgi:hypothetical protein